MILTTMTRARLIQTLQAMLSFFLFIYNISLVGSYTWILAHAILPSSYTVYCMRLPSHAQYISFYPAQPVISCLTYLAGAFADLHTNAPIC